MSRRTLALAASVIFGFGFILTITTEASAYRRLSRWYFSRALVSIVEAFTGVAITEAYVREWR